MATNDPMTLPGFEGLEGIELLQKLPLFRSLTFAETRALFAIARSEKKAKDEVLIEEDSLGTALYIVRSGHARVTVNGKEIGVRGPGELFGEMSLIDDVLTSARVVAVDDVEVLKFPRAQFDALMAGDQGLALKIYKAFCRNLTEKLRATNELVS